jgi:hypothetical protein
MISASHGAEHGGYVPAEHQTQHPWIFTVLQRFCALHLPRSVFIGACLQRLRFRLLRPEGFVAFSIPHPCFITPGLRWQKDETLGY